MLQPRGYQTVNLQLPLSCIAASGHHLSRTAGSRNIQTNLPGLSLPCPFQSIHPCSMPSLSTFCFLDRNDFAATPYLELKTMQSKTKQQQPKKMNRSFALPAKKFGSSSHSAFARPLCFVYFLLSGPHIPGNISTDFRSPFFLFPVIHGPFQLHQLDLPSFPT